MKNTQPKRQKNRRKSLIAVSCVILAAGVAAGSYLIYNRVQTDKYGLTELSTANIPSPVNEISDLDIQLSEVRMHYAVYGSEGRQPMILIHGNGSNHKALETAALLLANDYTVYSIDSRCHGKSSDPGEITYRLMAKDTAEFIEKLGLEKPYIMGHSDGAIVALTLAYDYPDLPGAVIACGANTKAATMKPYFLISVAMSNIKKHDKLNDLMLTLPDMTAEELERIKCPTDIVIAENDIMYLSDAVYMHNMISGSSLEIIKGANHSSYMSLNGKQAYTLAHNYLKELDKK